MKKAAAQIGKLLLRRSLTGGGKKITTLFPGFAQLFGCIGYFYPCKLSHQMIEHLVRENILRLTPYSSARSEFKGAPVGTGQVARIFIDANENPYDTGLNRYPDPLQWKLKAEIAAWREVKAEQIFLGNGSDEAIDLLVRMFCNPGQDRIIILPPTYGMYEVSADIAGVEVQRIPLSKDFQPDVDAILDATDAHTKLLFLCSPNNPTANAFESEKK
jgi:histidinol-phosphate aminotransferase